MTARGVVVVALSVAVGAVSVRVFDRWRARRAMRVVHGPALKVRRALADLRDVETVDDVLAAWEDQ